MVIMMHTMKILIMMIRLILPGVMREELVELLLRAHDVMLGGLHIYMTYYSYEDPIHHIEM